MQLPALLRRLLARLTAWAGVIFSLGALAALVSLLQATSGDLSTLVQPIAEAQMQWFAVAIALALSVEIVKTVRWQALLGAPPTNLPRLLALVFGSRLLNALAPLRAGDIWRVAGARAERAPLVLAGGSVVVEKALDGTALGLLSIPVLASDASGTLRTIALAGALAVALLLVAVRRWLGDRTRLAGWIAALGPLRDPRVLALAALLTAGGMTLSICVNLAVLQALRLPPERLPPERQLETALIMLVAGYAVGLVPSAPGRIGVFELGVSAPLIAAGVLTTADAFAAAVGLHFVNLATLALGGLIAVPLGLVAKTPRVPPSGTAPLEELRHEG